MQFFDNLFRRPRTATANVQAHTDEIPAWAKPIIKSLLQLEEAPPDLIRGQFPSFVAEKTTPVLNAANAVEEIELEYKLECTRLFEVAGDLYPRERDHLPDLGDDPPKID